MHTNYKKGVLRGGGEFEMFIKINCGFSKLMASYHKHTISLVKDSACFQQLTEKLLKMFYKIDYETKITFLLL